ncbi:MAG: hypothetical protein P8X74_21810 [Reinekea sp.]
MSLSEKMPRMLKTPTGWIMAVLVAGFFYMQWPTHVRQTPEPDYVWQTLDSNLVVRWEAEPEHLSDDTLDAWGLTRKGMSFLVQVGMLNRPFAEFVQDMADQDQKTVNGAVQEPMEMGDDWATYAFFDAESRIQKHQFFVKNGQWIKVSVLYKPSLDSRKQRAADFLANVHFELTQ